MGQNRSEQQCFNSDMKALLRQRLLGKRAAQSPFSFRRRKALDRIEDQSILAGVAIYGRDELISMMAVDRISDQEILLHVVLYADFEHGCCHALEKL